MSAGDVFGIHAPFWQIFYRSAIVYVAVVVGIRLTGRRQLGQMTPFDLAVLLLISNAVQNAMVGPDVSLSAGLLAACALVLVNHLLNWCISGSSWLQRRVVGTPTVLVNKGEFVMQHLRREGITVDEVLQAAREHGVEKVDEVRPIACHLTQSRSSFHRWCPAGGLGKLA